MALRRSLRRMAGLVFLLVFWVLAGVCQRHGGTAWVFFTRGNPSPSPHPEENQKENQAPSAVRPLARDPRVLVGWPFPLGFGLDGRLLLARRGRVYV